MGRGKALTHLMIDEAAFIEGLEQAWVSAWPTISVNGSVIVFSTPNGQSNFFYDLYNKADKKENEFNPIKLDWTVDPTRDEAWYKTTTSGMSKRQFAQEFNCLSGNARIFTKDGYKEIKDIKLNDEVLTHKGRFKKVIKLYKNTVNSEDVMTVSSPLSKNYSFEITKNHPILTAEKTKNIFKKCVNIKNYIKNNSYQTSWKTLNELDLECVVKTFQNGIFPKYEISHIEKNEKFDLMKFNIHSFFDDDNIKFLKQNKPNKRFINLNYDFGKFLGLFLGDGYYCDGYKKIGFSFHSNENDLIDFVKSFFQKYNIKFHISEKIKYNTPVKCTHILTTNKFIIELMKYFINGQYCYEKFLKNICFDLDKKVIKGIIDGLWMADAYHKPTTKNVLSITSEKLIYQIRILMSNFDCITRLDEKKYQYYDKIQYLLELNGTEYKNIDICTEHGLNRKIGSRTIFANGIWWGSPWYQKYNKTEKIDVYNIEVEEDNSYCTLGLIVHNCNFLMSGDTVIDPEDILRIKNELIEFRKDFPSLPAYLGVTRKTWTWEDSDPSRDYLISCDVARGDGEDYSTFVIIDISTFKTVGTYKDKIKTDDFAEWIYQVGEEYNNALVIVENNTYGWGVLQKLISMKYPNIFYTDKKTMELIEGYIDENRNDIVPGFPTNPKTRNLVITTLEECIRNKKITIYCPRIIEELESFIWERGKPQAKRGKNDDLVMALAIACFVKEVTYSKFEKTANLNKLFLKSFGTVKKSLNLSMPGDYGYRVENSIVGQENNVNLVKHTFLDEKTMREILGRPKKPETQVLKKYFNPFIKI